MIVEKQYLICTQLLTMLGPNYMENTLLVWCKELNQYMQTCQVLSASVVTEVQLLISVSIPTPISTWYNYTLRHIQLYTYGRTPNKHTCNTFIIVFRQIWSIITDLSMLSINSISSNSRCDYLSVPAHQHQLAPNMTIAGKTTSHHLIYKGES